MNINEKILKNEERISLLLRELYSGYGYLQYKMSKFEEYDLYARNKDFIVADRMITFTEANGKLMAMKPDVTLSIVKSFKDVPGVINKVFYDENVYRTSGSSHSFREIAQAGLECIGDVDICTLTEVLYLAAGSLALISADSILCISHQGIAEVLFDKLGLPSDLRKEAAAFIAKKNVHEFRELCLRAGADAKAAEAASEIIAARGSNEEILERIEKYCGASAAVSELKSVIESLSASGTKVSIVIDLSVVNDMSYYNGIVFKGFVDGVPESVLSGGQYDKLLRKLGRRSGAIGFAVYLDCLERFLDEINEYDVDTVLLYGEETKPSELLKTIAELNSQGLSVSAQKSIPEKLRYRQIMRI